MQSGPKGDVGPSRPSLASSLWRKGSTRPKQQGTSRGEKRTRWVRIVQKSATLTERPNKRMQPTPKDGADDSWR